MNATPRLTLSLCLVCFALAGACGGGDAKGDRDDGRAQPTAGSSGAAGSSAAGSSAAGSSGSSDSGSGSSGTSGFGQAPVQPVGGGTVIPMDGLDEDTCARANLFIERVLPRVVFLVDASSSMSDDFGGVSRWDALREALLADDGLVPSLQDIVKFGLVTYAGPRYMTCPDFRYAAPAPGNFDYVDAAFPGVPPTDSSTPTGASMDWTIDHAFLDQMPSPDMPWEPQFMIFATDGEPNGCAGGSTDEPPRDFDSVIAAAHKAAGRGIKVFVISLAEATGEFADHLTEVATIGETDTVYSPQSKEDLVRELETIIGSAISCEVEINAGRVREGMECNGTVTLGDEELECNGDDGWALVDPTHIELKGAACDDFKLSTTALVGAEFPCEALE